MNNIEKLDLYNSAKEAYYKGKQIMEDFEFDVLEKELGLENKSYIGTRHNPNYTIEHPFIMGSLAKVQIHEKNGIIDWATYFNDVCSYVYKNCTPDTNVIITPKFDGCSFEIQLDALKKIISISTRGDGEYGRDIKNHIYKQCYDATRNIDTNCLMCLRGEVLIDKNIFEQKYSEFVNPRSFVAGILNRDIDWDEPGIEELLNDLSIVIYDIRMFDEGNWVDCDWTDFDNNISTGLGYIPNKYLPTHFIIDENIEGPVDLEQIYNDFSEYRKVCPFALDGIVIKPNSVARINNLTDHRPKDCVAIKFIPMLEETEIVNIEWNLGKTGEWNPVVITNPVIMDGKTITRASGHNYGYLLDNKLSVGSKIILSLAGDIIPFIYKITNTNNFDAEKMSTPDNTYVEGCHLMALLSDDEIKHNQFVNSAITLNIPNLGPAEIENIWNYIYKNKNNFDETDEFFGFDISSATMKVIPNNILLLSPEDVYFGITSATKNGATGKANKIKKAFADTVRNITLKDVIKSCNFRFCGDKVAEQCANYLMNISYSFEHLASEGYNWCLTPENKYEMPNENIERLYGILSSLGKTVDDFKTHAEFTDVESSTQIPVILTGEPNDYKSKGEFLNCHPEYRLTGKWTEVQIVFTNSLESNTGKMKKAREKGIDIKLY